MNRINPASPFQEDGLAPFLDGRTIQSVRLLNGGKRTTNYKIELNDGNTCAVRFLDDETGNLERYVMDKVRETIPVPLELYRGPGFAVYSFIPGKPLRNVPEHMEEAGKVLARISAFTFEAPGRIGLHGEITPWPFAGIRGFFDRMTRLESVAGWLGKPDIERIKAVICREGAMIDELDLHRCLVHGDFNPSNILVLDGKVSGILDWEFSHSGTPYMDIGNMLRNSDERCRSRFRAGLAAGGMNLPPDWIKRAELVDLGSQLEFLTTSLSDDFKRGCVGRIRQFLSTFEADSG